MLPEAWRDALDPEGTAALAALEARLAREAAEAEIFPPLTARYRALELVAPEAVRVVILGQDPYHRPGQATGLAFSVPRGVRLPPSLRNVYRELKEDLGVEPPGHGDLSSWASQGVLLLNTALSVRSGEPASHAGYGWHAVTGALLRFASRVAPPSAFLLWGGHAQSRAAYIDESRHCVLAAGHPSFFSRHLFLGCRHFSRANAFLRDNGRRDVRWEQGKSSLR
jgi:uracil-DNA glycosylase